MRKRMKKIARSHRSAALGKKLARAFRKHPRTLVGAGVGAAIVLVLAAAVAGNLGPARQAPAAAAARSAIAPPPDPMATDPASLSGAESIGKEPARKAAQVTITGCLERDAETFRLKDTAGADAPKARSWKTGFLKRGSSSVAVIDAANRAKLPSHVGQRVSVTGTLVDREMQVRSLQPIAPSCSAKS
jgi:hypothetical protein